LRAALAAGSERFSTTRFVDEVRALVDGFEG
jgi:hypothetical protein